MRIGAGDAHLTYCSNIHPGERWDEVRANIEAHVPEIRRNVAPDRPFGIGLRLSANAAEALATPAAISEFRAYLDRERLYVFTLNGFPYGTFHGTRVKEDVYLPDWRDEARLRYTDRLADILVQLLPDGVEGSISTVPGCFKGALRADSDAASMAAAIALHVAHLVRIEASTGRRIALALEPEPCCFLETIEETVDFFVGHLFEGAAIDTLCRSLGVGRSAARELMRRHVGACLDLCHAAVEFEDCAGCFDALESAGISIPKLQVSAGLQIPKLSREAVDALHGFSDEVYLHQVVERTAAGLNRYVDLPEAFASLGSSLRDAEWRVHFHVPIFLEKLGVFESTQTFVREALARHRRRPVSPHLEVETYTWGVLPPEYRSGGVDRAIARELAWVLSELAA